MSSRDLEDVLFMDSSFKLKNRACAADGDFRLLSGAGLQPAELSPLQGPTRAG
jgi:hypothetical protein